MPKIKNLSNKGPYIIMEGDVFKSYGACNLKLTKPFTNLDLVTITTNLRELKMELMVLFIFTLMVKQQ